MKGRITLQFLQQNRWSEKMRDKISFVLVAISSAIIGSICCIGPVALALVGIGAGAFFCEILNLEDTVYDNSYRINRIWILSGLFQRGRNFVRGWQM
jgi:hypothetical protein